MREISENKCTLGIPFYDHLNGLKMEINEESKQHPKKGGIIC